MVVLTVIALTSPAIDAGDELTQPQARVLCAALKVVDHVAIVYGTVLAAQGTPLTLVVKAVPYFGKAPPRACVPRRPEPDAEDFPIDVSLAELVRTLPVGAGWRYEMKFDGFPDTQRWLCSPVSTAVVQCFGRHPGRGVFDVHEKRQHPAARR